MFYCRCYIFSPPQAIGIVGNLALIEENINKIVEEGGIPILLAVRLEFTFPLYVFRSCFAVTVLYMLV